MDKIVDVENYEEIDEDNAEFNDRSINGEPLYYSTGQVADRLGELASTVRFWCDEYNEFLKIERVGKTGTKRRFTETDIKKLEYIKYLLKQEKFSIQQAKEFLSSSEANKLEPVNKPKDQLMVEAVAKIVSYEVMNSFLQLKDEIIEHLKSQEENNRNYHEEIDKNLNFISENSSKLQEELKKDLNEYASTFLEGIDKFKNEFDEREKLLNEKEELLIKKLDELEKLQQDIKSEKKSGFFSKLFKK